MPRALSEGECKAHQKSVVALENEYAGLSAEEDKALVLVSDAVGVVIERRAEVGELMIFVATSEHVVEALTAQFRRCRERGTEDCVRLSIRLAFAEYALDDLRDRLEAAQSRLSDAQDRRQVLGEQFDEVVRAMAANDVRRRRHQTDMRKGHCLRFESH